MNTPNKHDKDDDPKDVKKPAAAPEAFPQPTVANPPPPQSAPKKETEKAKDEKPAGRHP
jgi:hypothetical protein